MNKSAAAALADMDQFAAGLTELMATKQGHRETLLLHDKLEMVEASPMLFSALPPKEQQVILRMAKLYLLERMANVVARAE